MYDLNKGSIINDEAIAEQFLSHSQVSGFTSRNDDHTSIDTGTINSVRDSIINNCIDYRDALYEETLLQYENERELRYKQTEENFNFRIESLKNSISEQKIRLIYTFDSKERQKIEGGIRITEYNLNRTLEEKEETLQNLKQNIELKVSHKIVSLNLITIR